MLLAVSLSGTRSLLKTVSHFAQDYTLLLRAAHIHTGTKGGPDPSPQLRPPSLSAQACFLLSPQALIQRAHPNTFPHTKPPSHSLPPRTACNNPLHHQPTTRNYTFNVIKDLERKGNPIFKQEFFKMLRRLQRKNISFARQTN